SATNPGGSTTSFSQCTALGSSQSLCNITCPANVTAAATSPAGAVVTFPQPGLGSSCSAGTVSFSQASGSTFPVGVTTVMVSARDTGGITASCSFTVTVSNVPIPVITSVIKEAKSLLVTGNNFDAGAVIVLDGVDQTTLPGDGGPNSILGKKSFK